MALGGYLSTLIHGSIVCIVAGIAAFSNNLVVLGILLALVTLVFIQSIVLNGCLMSKYDKLPFTDRTPTSFIRSIFCISEGELSEQTLEKVLIGLTAGFLFFKLLAIVLIESYTGISITKIRMPF